MKNAKSTVERIDYGRDPIPQWICEVINTSLAIEAEDARSAGSLGFMTRALVSATAYTGGLLKFIPFETVIVADYFIVISQRMSSTLILKPLIDHARWEIRKMLPSSLIVRS